jgi:Uma2 family endonuclease
MTVEEYLDFEERSTTRHEYVEGEVFAMSGVTRRHNDIVGNVYMRLRIVGRGGSCRVHFAEVKLRAGRVVYYPDVMASCAAPPTDERLEDAPSLVVEVLSPSTQSTDRREKLMVYKGIASLGAYLIIDQMQRRVDRHWRDVDGEWRHDVIVDDGAVPVSFGSVSLTITLDEIYDGVVFPTAEERLRLREEEAAYG